LNHGAHFCLTAELNSKFFSVGPIFIGLFRPRKEVLRRFSSELEQRAHFKAAAMYDFKLYVQVNLISNKELDA
jgi:hypothetical protein